MSHAHADPIAGPEYVGKRQVRGYWRGGYRVDLDIREGRFVFPSDERLEDGGSDTGPMPSEYLFASIASCFAMAVAWAARKRRLDLPDLVVDVSGGYDLSERRYSRIDITATSTLAVSAPEEFEQLVRVAEGVCWVTRSIVPGIAMTLRAPAPEQAADEAEGSGA